MRVSHPANDKALNLFLERFYLETAMVGKGEKSGRKGGPGNLGARVEKVEKGKCGKKLLEDRKYRVVGGGELVLGGKEGDWKVYKGLKKVIGGWENDEVRLEDKIVLDGSEWGMSGKGDWEVWTDSMEGIEEEGEVDSSKAVEEAISELRKKVERDMKKNGKRDVEEEEEEEEIEEVEEETKKKGKMDKGKGEEIVTIESSEVEGMSTVDK
ncbi:hypothetical protein B9Z19DRAFT_1110415 [Tuber borchii]|uniref:Uncharacterized protein n=1 Tax=Tuber borchii TaxID=42251 RepID=A0A2T6ZH96_TUBBO|nr:hypothetical protein B9Z19DRAFT_1110415 [Tuber borchii]